MLCPVCGIEMRIGSAGMRPEQEGAVLRMYHVARMECRNPQCRGGEAVESKTLVWESTEVAMVPVSGVCEDVKE